MTRVASALGALTLLGVLVEPVAAQPPKSGRPPAAVAPTHPGELECRSCHQGQHHGIVQMYLGLGGRGTPMIPSHMFQVRVQCVACHTAPKVENDTARIVGQTFRPSEQACVGCHGERYRGMLGRWTETLGKMRAIVAPKVAAARGALPAESPTPKQARARQLVQDAEHNLRFVELAHGVHNVFYAADLLKLANSWADETLALLGKPVIKTDDTLVRGGYCGVLCHEQAGVKAPITVAFGGQQIPHLRHVREFGAVCTACHSAEVHKTVSATPATCRACHHAPQNERCESCHRAQSVFYRGEVAKDIVKVEPNAMVNAVSCTGCHDLSRKHSRQAVGEKCVGCHDPAYTSFFGEWTTGIDQSTARAADAIRRAQAALGGRRPKDAAADTLLRDAREALALVQKARGAHNPATAEALLELARQKAEQALARTTGR
jgi:hypothetical protein